VSQTVLEIAHTNESVSIPLSVEAMLLNDGYSPTFLQLIIECKGRIDETDDLCLWPLFLFLRKGIQMGIYRTDRHPA